MSEAEKDDCDYCHEKTNIEKLKYSKLIWINKDGSVWIKKDRKEACPKCMGDAERCPRCQKPGMHGCLCPGCRTSLAAYEVCDTMGESGYRFTCHHSYSKLSWYINGYNRKINNGYGDVDWQRKPDIRIRVSDHKSRHSESDIDFDVNIHSNKGNNVKHFKSWFKDFITMSTSLGDREMTSNEVKADA